MQLIPTVRGCARSLLEQCNVPYKVNPFDEVLYQECIDDAMQRGYPVDKDKPLQTYLQTGVFYAANAGAHLHRPTQIWLALYCTYAIFMDDWPDCFPEEMPSLYLFTDRFIAKESQGNGVLDAFADIIRRAKGLYRPIASHLIITSTLNYVTSTLLEHETRSMKISSAAYLYPNYQRTMTGIGEAYGFMLFPREIPLNDYIQAIPEITRLIHDINDVLSFYKEERAGETTNQISTLAARTKRSKFEILGEVTETTIDLYKRISEILQGSPEACEVFKRLAAGAVIDTTLIIEPVVWCGQ